MRVASLGARGPGINVCMVCCTPSAVVVRSQYRGQSGWDTGDNATRQSWLVCATVGVPTVTAPTIGKSVAATFFPAAQAGLVVYEPFGGLCAGLEMVLRNGLPVHTYLYSDIDLVAQQVARHRIRRLQARYPGLLPTTALSATFTALPQDVWLVTPAHLQKLSNRYQRQWLVVVGMPGSITRRQGSRIDW